MGQTRRRKNRYTIGIAFEKGLGSERMNGTCGVEMSEQPKPCGAEMGEMNWTNGMKGGRLWGTNAVHRNAMWEVNEPTASTLKIKLAMYFFSAQLLGWWGLRGFSWVGGTPWLATFLVWFYLNQARYVFRSAYCVNVFDKLFGYQYHYWRHWRNAFHRKLCLYYSCLSAYCLAFQWGKLFAVKKNRPLG